MSNLPHTVAVDERHRLDEAALAQLLRETRPDFAGDLVVTQFPGGYSNPTYLLRYAARGGGQRRLVLRKKPAGRLLPSAHQVDREFAILRALAGSGIPVPGAILTMADGNPVLGQAFYLMEHVEGRIFTDPAMPGLAPTERAAIFDSMNAVLARLHALDHRALGLAAWERPEPYVARQIERWTKQYRAAQTAEIAAMERLIAWLPAHIPADASVAITHGDYKLANLVVHPHEPRVIAVLDWELWAIGHPLCDLGFNALAWHLAEPPAGLAALDWRALGVPGEQDYLAAYCRRTGRERIDDWNFYLAFNLFKLAAILQGVYRRALDGTAASPQSLARGALAAQRAEQAWRLVG
jgi:aminoglycoside phosphotransferase (APT) family kinase protein